MIRQRGLEKAPHSSALAWRIPGMAGPGRLPSMGPHRVGHDWSDLASSSSSKREARRKLRVGKMSWGEKKTHLTVSPHGVPRLDLHSTKIILEGEKTGNPCWRLDRRLRLKCCQGCGSGLDSRIWEAGSRSQGPESKTTAKHSTSRSFPAHTLPLWSQLWPCHLFRLVKSEITSRWKH